MGLLSRFFRSSQVRDCEAALRLLRPTFSEAMFYDELERHAADLIRKSPEAIQKKMLLDGQTAQATVLFLIANLAFRECASGANHTYRGTLSMQGQSYRQVFGIAQGKLVEIGAVNEQAASEANADLLAAIKEAG